MASEVINCVLSSPIERIRGGNILITVTTTIKNTDNGKVSQVSGFTFIKEETQALDGFNAAFDNSVANYNKLINTELKPISDILKTVLAPEAEVLKKETLANNPKNSQEIEKALKALPTEAKQKALDIICETHGIASINILDGSWTLLQAQALLAALEQKAKPLEAK
jgi:hypothetical protein